MSLDRKVEFLLSLECGIVEPCECEKCWKDQRFRDLRRENKQVNNYHEIALSRRVDREWKEVKKERYDRMVDFIQ